jgi:hypothetical protein
VSTHKEFVIVNGNRIVQQAADQKLVDGFTRHEAEIGSVLIDGKKVSPADVIAAAQSRIAASKAADAAKATWQTAVKADKDVRASTRVFMTQVRQAVLVMFASSIDTLAEFGLVPRKQHAVKPPTKVVAAAKAKATREARGTKGKRQKAKIKGAVVPPPATSPAVAAPAAPAPATPPR